MDPYPPIAEHGLVGDLQTAALITTDGSVDWFCCPRFDSPSIFGALLDDERGGHFRVRPAGTDYTSKQMYFPDTAVLVTRFYTDSGMGQVSDFMPPAGATATDRHRIVTAIYPTLVSRKAAGYDVSEAIASSAEGYAFPTNLDLDQPVDGMSPPTQADIVSQAVDEGASAEELATRLEHYAAARRTS